MKITIIFPGRSLETARVTGAIMPLAPTLLAALTPADHEVSLVDMFLGDTVTTNPMWISLERSCSLRPMFL
jgi:hypothetical protein